MSTFFVDYSATLSASELGVGGHPGSGYRSPDINGAVAYSSAPRPRVRRANSCLSLIASSRPSFNLGRPPFLKQSAAQSFSLDATLHPGSHPILKPPAQAPLDPESHLMVQPAAASPDVASESSRPHSMHGALAGLARAFLKQPAAVTSSLDVASSAHNSMHGALTGLARAFLKPPAEDSLMVGSMRGRVVPMLLASTQEELEMGMPPGPVRLLSRKVSRILTAGLTTNVLAPSSVGADIERERLARLGEKAASFIGCDSMLLSYSNLFALTWRLSFGPRTL